MDALTYGRCAEFHILEMMPAVMIFRPLAAGLALLGVTGRRADIPSSGRATVAWTAAAGLAYGLLWFLL